MLEAVSVALHAVKVTELKGGETTLVIGAGMIGLLTAQALRVAGPGGFWWPTSMKGGSRWRARWAR